MYAFRRELRMSGSTGPCIPTVAPVPPMRMVGPVYYLQLKECDYAHNCGNYWEPLKIPTFTMEPDRSADSGRRRTTQAPAAGVPYGLQGACTFVNSCGLVSRSVSA